MMKSVTVGRFVAKEVRARWRLVGDAMTSIKFWIGTLKNKNLSKSRVLDAKAVTQLNSVELASLIGKRTGAL